MTYKPEIVDAGRTFLEEVLGQLPEADREVARAVFQKAEAADALGVAGSGAKRQSEFSQHMDALRTNQEALDQLRADLLDTQAQQTAWWDRNQAAVQELATLKAGRTSATDPTKPVVDPKLTGLSREEVERELDAREQGAMGFMLLQNRLMREHWTAFGEFVDLEPLVNDPRARKVGLEPLYRETFKEKYAAKVKTELEARDKKLVEETEARVRRELGSRMPYPVGGAPETSTLDALMPPKEGEKPKALSEQEALDRAVDLYETESRRQQQQTA